MHSKKVKKEEDLRMSQEAKKETKPKLEKSWYDSEEEDKKDVKPDIKPVIGKRKKTTRKIIESDAEDVRRACSSSTGWCSL